MNKISFKEIVLRIERETGLLEGQDSLLIGFDSFLNDFAGSRMV